MSDFKTRFWWLFPIWRAILWSAAMGFLWSVLPFGLGLLGTLATGFWEANFPGPPSKGFELPAFIFVGAAFAVLFLLFAFLGLLPGFFAGVYASPKQPRNPFRSPFFRLVSGQTFLSFLASVAFFYLSWVAISVALHFVFTPKSTFYWHNHNLMFLWPIGTFLSYLFGISRAIRLAIQREKPLRNLPETARFSQPEKHRG